MAKKRASADASAAITASSGSLQDRLLDAERRFEDARDLHQTETRKLREQLKWRKLAEDRIADLESKLTVAGRELQDTKAARARDAQELLVNAKDRLETLHTEVRCFCDNADPQLSEAFQGSSPAEMPEYQRTLEDLVASNALLKHDTTELARTLSQTMGENRQLREEIEELKQRPPPRSRPLSIELNGLRPLLTRGHSRTGSNPIVSDLARPPMHARVASAAPRTSAWETERQHRRHSSIAPSFTSTSTTEGPSVTSPSPPSYDQPSPLIRTDSHGRPLSPTMRISSNSSNKRNSISTGIPYTVNGVPTSKRPPSVRKLSERRERRSITMRSLVGAAISEWPQSESEQDVPQDRSVNDSASQSFTDEPRSPSAESFAASEGSRKRASVLLPNVTSPRTPYDTLSPMSEGPMAFESVAHPAVPAEAGQRLEQKRVARRTLLLLSKSTGVQTDPIPEAPETQIRPAPTPSSESEVSSMMHSRQDSRMTTASRETPSLAELIDFLTRILTRLRGIDVPTLSRRLKKQNLPGDVGHVSRSTITSLQREVEEMRHKFRDLLDLGSVSRREITLLLKLLKDVFTDMLELQGVVNDVTINPKLAKKMQREAFQDETAETPQGGLGWIAAPITNWLSAPAAKPAEATPTQTSPRKTVARQPSRLQQPRTAPKLQASTSATTTHVSIEFGGSGQVRRAAPATPRKKLAADVFDAEPPTSPGHPRSLSVATSTPSLTPSRRAAAEGSARGRTARPSQSRSDLLGIFAGAQPGVSPGPSRPKVRHVSSQYFRGRAVTDPRDPHSREKLSTIVDAVLDPVADDEEFNPRLLERTLRPRGLSDSSIRSTAHAHAENPPSLIQPSSTAGPVPARAVALGSSVAATAYAVGSGLGSISRRFYSLRGAVEEPKQPKEPEAEASTSTSAEASTETSAEPPADPTPPGLQKPKSSDSLVPEPRRPSRARSPSPFGRTPRSASLAIPTAAVAVSTSVSPVGSVVGRLRMEQERAASDAREQEIETIVASQMRGAMVGVFAPGSLPLRGGWT